MLRTPAFVSDPEPPRLIWSVPTTVTVDVTVPTTPMSGEFATPADVNPLRYIPSVDDRFSRYVPGLIRMWAGFDPFAPAAIAASIASWIVGKSLHGSGPTMYGPIVVAQPVTLADGPVGPSPPVEPTPAGPVAPTPI